MSEQEVTAESLGTALTDLKEKKSELDESFADKTREVMNLGREVAAEVLQVANMYYLYRVFVVHARDFVLLRPCQC